MTDPGQPIVVLYNTPSPPGTGPSPAHPESEQGILEEVDAVRGALDRLGVPHLTLGLAGLANLPDTLYRHPARLAINLVEGFQDHPSDMVHVPAVCRAFGVEVTGNDTPCMALVNDKWRTRQLLSACKLPVPEGVLVKPGDPIPPGLPRGLCIVKPVALDASEGIDADSVVDSRDPRLHERVDAIHRRYSQPALIESFVGSRELNVSLLQTGHTVRIVAIAEIDFSAFTPDRPRLVGYSAKWRQDSFEYRHTPRRIPAPLTPEQDARVRDVCLRAWEALGCRDYARVDLRLADDGHLVVLEVNPNPDISPDAGFPAALHAAGISFDLFVRTLLDNAAGRQVPCSSSSPLTAPPAHGQAAADFRIRFVEPDDRDAVLSLLTQPRFFRPDELRIAEEVLDDSLRDGRDGHYQSYVLDGDGVPAGWVCFGPTPCTVGTFDIYWIAVASRHQHRGMGKALTEFAEARIAERGGRLAVVETSGRDDYAPTRQFYLRNGYRETARVKDFYAPGDDKIISVKRIKHPGSGSADTPPLGPT